MNKEIKARFIDCIWQSRTSVKASDTIRKPIVENIFRPFNNHMIEIYNKVLVTANPNEMEQNVQALYKYYLNNSEFRKYIAGCTRDVVRDYDNYLNKFSGYNSLVAATIYTTDYNDKELNRVADGLLDWYNRERTSEYQFLCGAFLMNAFDLNKILYDIFVSMVSTLLGTYMLNIGIRLNIDIVSVFQILMNGINGPITQEIKKRNIPTEILSNYLYTFDIEESLINKFQSITVKGMKKLLSHIPINKQIEFFRELNQGAYKYSTIKKYKELKNWFWYVEHDKNKYTYIFEPYGSIIKDSK